MNIAPIEIEDAENVADIYEKYLNSGAAIREHIRADISMKKYVGYKAVEDGKIVGIMSGRPGIDFTYPHPELEEEIKNSFPGEEIFSNESILILPEYRNHGLARELSRKMVRKIYEKGYRLLLAELWIYPDGSVPAAEITDHWGQLVYEKRKELFYDQLEQYGMECPLCGSHCICGAMIRLFRLTERPAGGEKCQIQN